MSDGRDCKCAAHSEYECCCGADWTPEEVYKLRAENAELEKKLCELLCVIHRDGGQYIQQHGQAKAYEDAVSIVHQWKLLPEENAALAEQNAKMRKALTKWRYLDGSYNWRCGHCGNEVEDGHKEGCALSLPDLASPVLNRIRAEAMEEAADICSEKHSLSAAEEAIRARADELEKTNG